MLRVEMHMDSCKELSKGATRWEGGEEKRRERNQRRKRGMRKLGDRWDVESSGRESSLRANNLTTKTCQGGTRARAQ